MYINVFLLDEIQYVLSVWKMSIDKIISLHLIHVHLSIIKIISKLTGKFNIDFFYRWPIDTVITKFHFKQIYTRTYEEYTGRFYRFLGLDIPV